MQKMNRKGTAGDELKHAIVFTLLLVIFISLVVGFIYQRQNSAVFWEQVYTAEMAKTLNMGTVGDIVTFDIQKATKVAKKNGVQSFDKMFSFDNCKHLACVQLSSGKPTCISYFNNVQIDSATLVLGIGKANLITYQIAKLDSNCKIVYAVNGGLK